MSSLSASKDEQLEGAHVRGTEYFPQQASSAWQVLRNVNFYTILAILAAESAESLNPCRVRAVMVPNWNSTGIPVNRPRMKLMLETLAQKRAA